MFGRHQDIAVLEMPETPAQVLEPLSLLQEAGNLCADLREWGRMSRDKKGEEKETGTFQVFVKESVLERLPASWSRDKGSRT
jgi:hypothetical protein